MNKNYYEEYINNDILYTNYVKKTTNKKFNNDMNSYQQKRKSK